MTNDQLKTKIRNTVSTYKEVADALDTIQQARNDMAKSLSKTKTLQKAFDLLQESVHLQEEEFSKEQTALISLLHSTMEYVWQHPDKDSKLKVSISKSDSYNDEGLFCQSLSYTFSGELGELLNLIFDPFIEDGDLCFFAYTNWGRKFSSNEIKKLSLSSQSTYDEFLDLFKTHFSQSNLV